VGIPFADIDIIKFTDEPPEKNLHKWKPALNIKLRDGKELKGKLVRWGQRDQRFTGEIEDWSFSLPIEKVRQAVFDHKQDKNAPKVGPGKKDIKGKLNSEYTISVKTWQGNEVTLLNGGLFTLSWGYHWRELKTELDFRIGKASNVVGFDKIKSIQFQEKGKPECQLTATSGKTIDISLSVSTCMGGNLDKFRPAWIRMSEVSSFEISRNVKK